MASRHSTNIVEHPELVAERLMRFAECVGREKFAHDRALHYLAGRQECELPDGVRHWLAQVVEGYTGRCDEGAARRGIEWMRDKASARS